MIEKFRRFKMATSILILACILALSGSVAAEAQETEADQIVQRYLKMPQKDEISGLNP